MQAFMTANTYMHIDTHLIEVLFGLQATVPSYMSQTLLSVFSVSGGTLMLKFVVFLERGYQHCHTEFSPVNSFLVIEFSRSAALLCWRCPVLWQKGTNLWSYPPWWFQRFPGFLRWHYPTTMGCRHFFRQTWALHGSSKVFGVDQPRVWQNKFDLESFNRAQSPGFRWCHNTPFDTLYSSWSCKDTAEWNLSFSWVVSWVDAHAELGIKREGSYGPAIRRLPCMI